MPMFAGGVPSAAHSVAPDTGWDDHQSWQRHVLRDEGGLERRRRGVRRSSMKGEKRETRLGARHSLLSSSSFVSFSGSPAHHLIRRAPAARRRSRSSRASTAGRPRNDKFPCAQPRARPVSLSVSCAFVRFFKCFTSSSRGPRAALPSPVTQLCTRRFTLDAASMPSPSR
jgi:hypothetical protein